MLGPTSADSYLVVVDAGDELQQEVVQFATLDVAVACVHWLSEAVGGVSLNKWLAKHGQRRSGGKEEGGDAR